MVADMASMLRGAPQELTSLQPVRRTVHIIAGVNPPRIKRMSEVRHRASSPKGKSFTKIADLQQNNMVSVSTSALRRFRGVLSSPLGVLLF